jgi:hypothetical protein
MMFKALAISIVLASGGTIAGDAIPGPDGAKMENAAIAGPTGRSKRCRTLNVSTGRTRLQCYTRGGRTICYRVAVQGRQVVCS